MTSKHIIDIVKEMNLFMKDLNSIVNEPTIKDPHRDPERIPGSLPYYEPESIFSTDIDDSNNESGSLTIDVSGPGSHEFISELVDFIRHLSAEMPGVTILDMDMNISNVQ